MQFAIKLIALGALFTGAASCFSMNDGCSARSGALLTPVVELYTSEGCSSCPPADKWLSTLKDKGAVVQAFHVGYWDYIGWIDRFATPAHTARQRQVAAWNRQRAIYTPQAVLNGRDWRDWGGQPSSREPGRAAIVLSRQGADQFEASVTPTADSAARWSAYWSVTEHGHSSRIRAGENAGEFLRHDFVVRQYTPVGDYRGAQTLRFNAIAADPKHARQVNLVVFEPATGRPLQALALQCAG